MSRWVFWDIGDTLLNEDPLRCRIWEQLHQILRDAGRAVPFEALLRERERLAGSGDTSPHYTIAREQLTPDRFDAWREQTVAFVRGEGQTLLTPISGIPEALGALGDDFSHGIIADQPVEVLDTLGRLGLRRYFASVTLSEEVGTNKPGTAIFEHALSSAGCRSSDAVMVGNRLDMDCAPARRVGMRTLFCYLQPQHKGWVPKSTRERAYLDSLARVPNWAVEPDAADPYQQPGATFHDAADVAGMVRELFGNE